MGSGVGGGWGGKAGSSWGAGFKEGLTLAPVSCLSASPCLRLYFCAVNRDPGICCPFNLTFQDKELLGRLVWSFGT